MSVFVNDGGVEREAKMIYVNDGGIDKLVAGAPKPPHFPEFGEPFEGGFFAGLYVFNNVVRALIVAPKSAEIRLPWKTSQTSTAGTTSRINGLSNSNSMNNANHPAAQHCRSYNGGGFNDWFLPADLQLEIAYFTLKPGTSTNTTTGDTANSYAVPSRSSNYTSAVPSQTSSELFQEGGEQEFVTSLSLGMRYWSSTQQSGTNAWLKSFLNGSRVDFPKSSEEYVRPFREIIVY